MDTLTKGEYQKLEKPIKKALKLKYKINKKKVSAYSKELKLKPTFAEIKMKEILKENGIKFKFQVGYASSSKHYIADFKLQTNFGIPIVMEIDGGYHDSLSMEFYDAKRTKYLEANKKCIVIRFTNDDVFTRPQYILNYLKRSGVVF